MAADTHQAPVIVGCGYLGTRLATLLSAQSPVCIVRSRTSYAQLIQHGLHAQIQDLDDAQQALTVEVNNRAVYYLAPPGKQDNCDHRIDRFLSACRTQPPAKIVYISTSGVYGDCGGNWVDENQPLAPSTERALRRQYAEQALITFCQQHSTRYIILRVGGIYGPDRLPLHRLNDITLVCPQDAPYSNRIHVSDLATICLRAMSSDVENEIFNVSDGHATSMTDYFYKIADMAGLPRPPCVPLAQAHTALSPAMLSFIKESRRLSTDKLHACLDIEMRFPTLTAGLKDCLRKPG